MRMKSAALLSCSLMLASCAIRPAFLPAPAQVLSGFQALRQPRPDLPVGALWITGYGLYGDGAPAANIETVKTLSSATFDSGVQATLSLGILQFLDLDPSLRNKITARLNDVSIVRVKDMGKLSGPPGQWRVYEALKAASITITVSKELGLDIESHASQRNLPVFGRGTTGRLSTYTIEARDAFFAMRVTRLVPVEATLSVALGKTGIAHPRLGSTRISIATLADKQGACPQVISVGPVGAEDQMTFHDIASGTRRELAVPIAADAALYTTYSVDAVPPCNRLKIKLEGSRVEALRLMTAEAARTPSART